MDRPNIDRDSIDLEFNGEIFDALLFEIRGEEAELQEYAQTVDGEIYTFLDCDGCEVFLRGRHYVNRIAYTVLPKSAPEEIISWRDEWRPDFEAWRNQYAD